jgi:tetratricopeptide (TPR) repeat protein
VARAGPQELDDPRMPGVPFEELQRRADEARAAGRVDEALRFYRAGVELNPLWHEGWFYVGSIHYAQDRFDRARSAFRRVVASVPESGPAGVHGGRVADPGHRGQR